MKWSMTADFHLIPNRRILGRVEGVAAWSSPLGHDRLDRSEQHESISQLPNANSTTDASSVSPFAGASCERHHFFWGKMNPSPSNLKADAPLLITVTSVCVHHAQWMVAIIGKDPPTSMFLVRIYSMS
jgi:hypothetical protein